MFSRRSAPWAPSLGACAALFFVAAGPIAPPAVAGQTLQLAEAVAGDDYVHAIRDARAAILEIMQEQAVPGASIAVGVGHDIVWSEGFGWADVEQRVPVGTETRFRVGSVSKTMTATGLGLLLERGLVDLDADVRAYVPDFPEKRWPFTVRQLAGHLAGIRHYRGQENFSSRRYPTVASGLEIFDDDPLLFEPGTDYSYSSYGFNLLSATMEGASGVDFLTFMRDEVFEPLGLRHTVADHTDSIIPHRTAYYVHGRDDAVLNAPFVDNSYKWAGGGFLSTPEDMVRFGLAHLRPGFLGASTLRELQTAQALTDGEGTGYGVGWMIREQSDGDETVGHSGGSVGGTSLLLLVPEHDLVVAGTVNVSGGPASAMVRRVAELFEVRIEEGR